MSDFSYNPVQTFGYNPLGGSLTLIQLSLLTAPDWSTAQVYPINTAVRCGTTYWISLMANQGINPLASGQVAWSPLVPMQLDVRPGLAPVGSPPPVPSFGNCPCPPPPLPGHCPPPRPCHVSDVRITSFEVLPRAVVIGDTGDTIFNFVWTLAGSPRQQTLYPGGAQIAANVRTYSTTTNFTTSTTFKLEVLGFRPEDYDSREIRVPLVSPVYYGVSASTTLDAEGVKALSTSFVETLTLTATLEPKGKYVYLAFPVRLGEAMTYIDGFHTTAWESSVVSITNQAGYVENYTVLRSSYIQASDSLVVDAREKQD